MLAPAALAQATGSPYIEDIERDLQQLGYDVGTVDGVFDLELQAGINAFKADAGLAEDGLLDRDTRALIQAQRADPDAISNRAAPGASTTSASPEATTPSPQSRPATAIAPSETEPTSPASPPSARPAIALEPSVASTARTTRSDASFGERNWRAARQAYRRRFGVVAELAAEFGGENVVTVTLDNNDREDITTGDGIVLAGGAYYLLQPDFGLQGSLGYKVNETTAEDSDLGIDRWTLELTAFKFFGEVQLAAGLVHHRNIDFEGDGFLPDFSFDDATGLKVDIAWRWFALSYTQIDYEVNGFRFDAGNIGLRLRGGF